MMQTHSRRQFLASLGLTTTTVLLGSSAPVSRANSSKERKPNIIFIMADDLGYGDLGCYGQKRIQTPSLDRMATEGMRFTQCYAGSTVCAPSRCSLMTGLHTGHSHIRGNKQHPLLPECVTVAEVLKDSGYATGIIGKWGLGEPETCGIPNRQGFDYWFGYLNQSQAHNYYPNYLWENETKFFFESWRYSHDVFTEKALDFVRQNRENPFFLYLPYTIPHAFNEGGVNGMPVPSDQPYSHYDWPQNEKNKAAMITRMDRDIGKLFGLLKELGIDDHTIVFFTSDNGPHREGGIDPDFFDSHGVFRGIKRDLYEGGIRVPMIVRWPGIIQAGIVSDQIWAFWDFPSTAADLAGTTMPQGVDGLSMRNALLRKPQENHEYLYWEFHEMEGKRAIRMQNWKAVRSPWNSPIELYDLSNDLGETNNIANAYPDLVQKFNLLFQSARTENEFYPISF